MRFHLRSLVLVALMGSAAASAQPLPKVDIYKSPTCDCCAKWIAHMQKSGFKVDIHEVANTQASRKKLGMPDKFGSCHTSKIGEYVVEGHVPAADIKQLLKEKPKALGLAVPSMPPGSPGMDIPNSPPYETLLVQTDGSNRVYAKH
jgi:hypothetical protein